MINYANLYVKFPCLDVQPIQLSYNPNKGRQIMKLTMLMDSQCPLCAAEVGMLTAADVGNRLRFQDIHAPDFSTKYPELDWQDCYDTLHVLSDNGDVIKGLDATCAVWNAVGKHRWLNLLRLPGIGWVADRMYRLFANNRSLISRIIMGKSDCKACEK